MSWPPWRDDIIDAKAHPRPPTCERDEGARVEAGRHLGGQAAKTCHEAHALALDGVLAEHHVATRGFPNIAVPDPLARDGGNRGGSADGDAFGGRNEPGSRDDDQGKNTRRTPDTFALPCVRVPACNRNAT